MWNYAKIGDKKFVFTLWQQMEKSFVFVFNVLNFVRSTRISSSLILNILIGWAVEYFDVMFYYFLLADNSGYYKAI